ncbi:hypothetical protein BDP27DRAFT_1377945 [Rhodocollybia butyracea]|uniref:Uncharacterized protein n=1 Tax=Rhodocollybia butyracea TaxID=206335 RepID=A0A9P5P4J3_9AGAR|nr:hypothetical protein BDP27DRAFT_1377945 [Rhodocollybia butyracea]
MSGTPAGTPAPDVPTSLTGTCSVQMQTYAMKATGKRQKSTKMTKDQVKTKSIPFTFLQIANNYMELMTHILVKYGLDSKFKVTTRRVFQMKIQIPGEKKNQARDVDNEDEYLEVVEDIINSQTNMQHVQQHAKKIKADDNNDSDDEEEEDAEAENETNENGVTKTQAQLLKFRELLEGKYGNTKDSAFTIIDKSTGLPMDAVPGVTLDDPLFMPRKPLPILTTPHHQYPSNSESPTSEGTTMLGHLATVFSSLSDLTNRRSQSPSRTAPSSATITSPAKNSPTKLPRFLEYAEKELGIEGAMLHRHTMEKARYGPDILSHVADEKLVALGVPEGDVIRLKQAAPVWWKGADAKRKRNTLSDEGMRKKHIRFEKRFKDGGGGTMWGTGLRRVGDDDDLPEDYDWFYFSSDVDALVPVPANYLPVFEDNF